MKTITFELKAKRGLIVHIDIKVADFLPKTDWDES